MFFYQFTPLGETPSIPTQLVKYKCVLLIEREIDGKIRDQISRVLVESGCLYAMAWGLDCSLWDDSIDMANIEQFPYGDIPDDKFVMTTWHEDETIEDVLRFAKVDAVSSYTNEPLTDILIIDFSLSNRGGLVQDIFNRVK